MRGPLLNTEKKNGNQNVKLLSPEALCLLLCLCLHLHGVLYRYLAPPTPGMVTLAGRAVQTLWCLGAQACNFAPQLGSLSLPSTRWEHRT